MKKSLLRTKTKSMITYFQVVQNPNVLFCIIMVKVLSVVCIYLNIRDGYLVTIVWPISYKTIGITKQL